MKSFFFFFFFFFGFFFFFLVFVILSVCPSGLATFFMEIDHEIFVVVSFLRKNEHNAG